MSWCRTQAPVAWSSFGPALDYGDLGDFSELSWLNNLLNELGCEVGLKILTCSPSAMLAAERKGGSRQYSDVCVCVRVTHWCVGD